MGVSPSLLPLKGLEVTDSNNITYLESIILNTCPKLEYRFSLSKQTKDYINPDDTIRRSLYMSLFLPNHREGIKTIERFLKNIKNMCHVNFDDIYMKMMLKYRRFSYIHKDIIFQITHDDNKLNLGYVSYLLNNDINGYDEEVNIMREKFNILFYNFDEVFKEEKDNKVIFNEIINLFSSI